MNADTSHLTLLPLTKEQLVEKIQELNEEVEGLREKLDKGTEEHRKDTKKLNEFVEKNCVPKDIVFAERSGFTRQIEKLTKENEELKKSLEELEEEHQILEECHKKPFRVYFGYKAYKLDLPSREQFFETLDDAKKYIDEINKDGDSSIKVSYDNIDYHPYIDE